MSNTNFTWVGRMAERSMQIGRDGEDSALKCATPAVAEHYQAYQECDKRVRFLQDEELDERGDRNEMVESFGNYYDKTISAIYVRKPNAQLPGRSSALTTAQDLLNYAGQVDDYLSKLAGIDGAHPIDGQGEAAPNGEPWALDKLVDFRRELAMAISALYAAVIAAQQLQHAVEDRGQKRQALESRLAAFRRLVRDVYGRRSREYRSLRPRGEPAEKDNPPAPQPVPVPAAAPAAGAEHPAMPEPA